MNRPYTTDQLVRMQRLDAMKKAVDDYWSSTGVARARCRRNARHAIAEFRIFHMQPERASFEAAVARSKARKVAA